MANFPPVLNSAQIGNGGGWEERLCNAVAAKQGKSAACCPFPCAASPRTMSALATDVSLTDASIADVAVAPDTSTTTAA
jgi:hypothetical protein